MICFPITQAFLMRWVEFFRKKILKTGNPNPRFRYGGAPPLAWSGCSGAQFYIIRNEQARI